MCLQCLNCALVCHLVLPLLQSGSLTCPAVFNPSHVASSEESQPNTKHNRGKVKESWLCIPTSAGQSDLLSPQCLSCKVEVRANNIALICQMSCAQETHACWCLVLWIPMPSQGWCHQGSSVISGECRIKVIYTLYWINMPTMTWLDWASWHCASFLWHDMLMIFCWNPGNRSDDQCVISLTVKKMEHITRFEPVWAVLKIRSNKSSENHFRTRIYMSFKWGQFCGDSGESQLSGQMPRQNLSHAQSKQTKRHLYTFINYFWHPYPKCHRHRFVMNCAQAHVCVGWLFMQCDKALCSPDCPSTWLVPRSLVLTHWHSVAWCH